MLYYTIAGNSNILIKTNYKTKNKYFLSKLKKKLENIFNQKIKMDNNKLKTFLIKYHTCKKDGKYYNLKGNGINACNMQFEKIINIEK
ncbi:MAG: hypothetical protein ACOCP8_07135 [archaeon]